MVRINYDRAGPPAPPSASSLSLLTGGGWFHGKGGGERGAHETEEEGFLDQLLAEGSLRKLWYRLRIDGR